MHEPAEEIKALKKEINEVTLREEMMWNQRSRALWVKCGDSNTKFFHEMASNRRRRNRLRACVIKRVFGERTRKKWKV